MASLPNNSNIDSQYTAGFNTALFVINDITITASDSVIKKGDSVGLSGVSDRTDGNAAKADLIVRDSQGNESWLTTIEGSYDLEVQPSETGEYDYFLRNDLPGRQGSEQFNLGRISGIQSQHTEGFNS